MKAIIDQVNRFVNYLCRVNDEESKEIKKKLIEKWQKHGI